MAKERPASGRERVADSSSTPGTDLVAIQAMNGPACGAPESRFRPSAPLVTQLFAMKLDLPQTRIRRRATTEEAVTAYGATRTVLRTARRATGLSWPA